MLKVYLVLIFYFPSIKIIQIKYSSYQLLVSKELAKFENSTVIIRSRESKDKQYNIQKSKKTNRMADKLLHKKLDIGQDEYHYKLEVNTGAPEGFDVFSDSPGFVGLCFYCIFNLCCLVFSNEISKRNTKTNTNLSIFFVRRQTLHFGYLIPVIHPVTGGVENLSGDRYWL
jgi:hypothetical protein